ncbi:MAG: DASS family sodium-coupled anion symporter [Acidobacteriota bacterium]|nr:MAG: DASS family sodium-coupled anion symporter [Acidobacteriota bacterium]
MNGIAVFRKTSPYERAVNYKAFGLAVLLFTAALFIPTPESMRDVAVEETVGERYVLDFISGQLFGQHFFEVQQWEAATCRILFANLEQGMIQPNRILGRTLKQTQALGVDVSETHFLRFQGSMQLLGAERFSQLMMDSFKLHRTQLSYDRLSDSERREVDRAIRKIKVTFALAIFVVVCFLTEAIPLPGVAFCIGLILVFSGIVGRSQVAALYWSDAVWFIMGSLMFAAAFVKTGIDKRICLAIFSYLAKPDVGRVTAVLILVIAPAAAFISDHALAAMFLPIGVILYSSSLTDRFPQDPELAKMLMVTIAMACNIGGFGSPSGGARNVVMMTYMEEMFGYSIGYGQWMLYGFPFVIIMMPLLWILLQWRFRPSVRNLRPAMESLQADIARGGWTRHQVIAVLVFLVMLLGWVTEQDILTRILGIRLGIGVIAMAGAIAYLLFGVVGWKDYQEKVDWGVVWLYAGAIIFGRVLDETGTAYWLARSVVEGLAYVGLHSGTALLAAAGIVTAGMTQLMADGPAAAAVGPVTLNMAAVAGPGTVLVPFMALVTACASSMAYLLIIGTPPNAIVYASGYLEPKDFLRVGIPCLVLSFLVMLFLSMLIWPLFEFPGLAPIAN